MKLALLSNMALGHKKLKQWREVVGFCDEALRDHPDNVKALFRKADALGELCDWKAAEEAAARLEAMEEGRKLAEQKREEWRRKQKAADGKQRKMWSAALAESTGKSSPAPEEEPYKEDSSRWTAPKAWPISVFDLRRAGVEWVEGEDFSDATWRDGLGVKEAVYFQKLAMPLTLLAAGVLAEIKFPPKLVVHCFLDGHVAPFSQPHDWNAFLQRSTSVESITVVYIDFGRVEQAANIPYGQLLRPKEEGKDGQHQVRTARFLGSYREFLEHCKEVPGIVKPHVAFWADVPFYGWGDADLARRVEAYDALAAAGVPSVITQGGEVPDPRSPPRPAVMDEFSKLSIAILSEGLSAKMPQGWYWNRFIVPLDRGANGILAAHALVGVVQPVARAASSPSEIKDVLQARGVDVVPFRIRKGLVATKGDPKVEEVRKKQHEAFIEKLRLQGRPIGKDASDAERHRQAMEFHQFCGMQTPP